MLFHRASFSFFIAIDLYFLNLETTAKIFNPIVELIIPTEISIKEAKTVTNCPIVQLDQLSSLPMYFRVV